MKPETGHRYRSSQPPNWSGDPDVCHTWALVAETLAAVEAGRADAQLLVLEVKAAAGEAAADAADLALRAGGGAAFRKESVVERLFRDSRAARVMAPTTDALHDFIGRALCGLPLLGDVG